MAAPAAAPVAGAYIGLAALGAGIVYLATPQGQRTAQSLGEAMYDGGANAVDNIKSLFSAEEEENTVPTTASNTTTRDCDGPHGGRLQSQGYRKPDPGPVELSRPWRRPCTPPLRAEGRFMVSALFNDTRDFSFMSAGLRARAFAAMSKHISSSPPIGFLAGHKKGWGIAPNGDLRPNLLAGPRAPRVDLEVHEGRAFGDW